MTTSAISPPGADGSVNGALAAFSPQDYTVRLCDTLFGVVPFAGASLSYRSLDEAIGALYPQATPQVKKRAHEIAQGEGVRSALWTVDKLDTVDAGIAAHAGVKGVYNLFFGDRSKALETDTQQGIDAVVKLLGIGYIIARLYPGSIQERVQLFYATPAGKQIIVYYALVEVALPFFDNAMTGGGNFIGSLLDRYGGEASGKLGSVLGGQAAGEAHGVVQTMLGWIEGALTSVLPYAQAAADKARPVLPAALSVADKVASVVATGADALPVYRYLGARLAAESAVLIASRE